MNIANKMRDLMEVLRKEGVNGVRTPAILAECEDAWNEGYAIAYRVYPDETYEFYGDSESDWMDDVERFVKGYFGPTVAVNFRWRSQEIEAIAKS